LNQGQGVAAPPAAHTVSPPPPRSFRPTQWVGVRADRFAHHFGPAGHSVLRRAGRGLPSIALWRRCAGTPGFGHATIQTTNDAYVRAELTRLSSRVAGEVLTVAAKDFPARQGWRSPGSDRSRRLPGAGRAKPRPRGGAQAALDNLSNQVELAIRDDCAGRSGAGLRGGSGGRGAPGAGTPAIAVADRIRNAAKARTGNAAYAKAQADVRASRAVIAAQPPSARSAVGNQEAARRDLEGAKATLAEPSSGSATPRSWRRLMVLPGERQVQPGDYLSIFAAT